jgi:hypothetical protein
LIHRVVFLYLLNMSWFAWPSLSTLPVGCREKPVRKKRTLVFILSECLECCPLRCPAGNGTGTALMRQLTHGQVPPLSASPSTNGKSMSLIHRIRLYLLHRRADALLRRIRKQRTAAGMPQGEAQASS